MDVIQDLALDSIASHFERQLTQLLRAEPRPKRLPIRARAIADGLLSSAAEGQRARPGEMSYYGSKWQELGDATAVIARADFEREAQLLNVFASLIAPSLAFDEQSGDAVEAEMVLALRGDPTRREALNLPAPSLANQRVALYLSESIGEPPSPSFFVSVASTFTEICVTESGDIPSARSRTALACKGLEIFGISLESSVSSLAAHEVAA